MSENPTVISLFAEPGVWRDFPRKKILEHTDAFIKCDSYDVYLPIISSEENELNIFEDVVLRLSALHRVNLETVCRQLCLEPDFARIILEHLIYKKYIEDDGQPGELGKAYLNQSEETQAQKSQRHRCRVLVLKRTGEILPHLFPADDNLNIRSQLEKRKMTIAYNTKGKPQRASGFIWTPQKSEQRARSVIQQTEIIRIVQAHNLKNPLKMLRLKPTETIDISRYPSEVYLHVKMILQRGLLNSVIVSDGSSFVNGAATKYAQIYHQEAIAALRQKAERNIRIDKKSPQNFQKYGEVHKAMQLTAIPQGDTNDDHDLKNKIRGDNLINMHSALEWACAYCLRMCPIEPEHIRSLQVNTCEQNRRILLTMARQLGFVVNDKEENLLGRLDGLYLQDYQSGEVPNLHVLLPLTIFSAKHNADCRMRNVAAELPYIFHTFNRLAETKMLRHGNEKINDSFDDYESIEVTLRKFLKLLLPGYAEEDVPTDETAPTDEVSLIRLHAEENAAKLLGRDIYERLGNRLQADIRALALAADSDNVMNANDFVICLARVEENYLRTRAEEHYTFERRQKAELLEYLVGIAKAQQADYNIPKEISTVREDNVKLTVKHGKGTLGAYALVYLGNISSTNLKNIDLPSALNVIAETLRYRQHGNNIGLSLSKEKMDDLRDRAFNLLKILEKYSC